MAGGWVRMAGPAAAGVATASAIGIGVALAGRPVPPAAQAVASSLTAVAVVAAWITVRRWMRHSKVEARRAAAQAERARLAREMHDSLSKTLDALALGAAALPSTLAAPDRAARLADTLREGSLTAARDARALIDGLRTRPADAPLHVLLEAACREWSSGTGVPVRSRVTPVAAHPELAGEIAEIAREALRNVAYHAEATAVEVTLTQRRGIMLTISDDGRGLSDIAEGGRGSRQVFEGTGRYGLLGMAERARLAGGRLRVTARPEGGTTVEVSFPAGAAAPPVPSHAALPAHPGMVLAACAATLAAAITVMALASSPARKTNSHAIIQTGQSPTPVASQGVAASPSAAASTAAAPSPGRVGSSRAPARQPVQATGSCAVRYTVREQWNTGFTADITITNRASIAIDGWSLVFSFTPNQKLLAAWDATAAQNGRVVTVSDGGRKTVIAAGQSISFGLQGTWSQANPVPAAFTLNGLSCARA